MKPEFQQGKIKQYDADRGFGFIGGLEQDIFFHISDFPLAEGEPKRNERVKFIVVENNGKLKATKIERVEDRLPIICCLILESNNVGSTLLHL